MDQKSEDCYFYYYSSCAKGDGCAFRHCPQALGNETVCSLWREGRCTRIDCKFRHMDIKVSRSVTACYWESQPGGCTKPHCVFMHTKRKGMAGGLTTLKNRTNPVPLASSTPPYEESAVKSGVATLAQSDILENRHSPQVAPVVVNPMDEESDADSITGSPMKLPTPQKTQLIEIQDPLVTDDGSPAFEDPEDEELRKVKEALAKAEAILSQTDDLPAESYDEILEELNHKIQTVEKIDNFDNIPVARRTIQVSGNQGVKKRKVEPQAGRRIILANEEEEEEYRAVSTSPRKAVSVMERLGASLNKDTKHSSRKESGLKGRLGAKSSPDSKHVVKMSGPSVRGRLGVITRKVHVDLGDNYDDDQRGMKGIKNIIKPTVPLSHRFGGKPKEDRTDSNKDLRIRSPEDIRRGKVKHRLGLSSDAGDGDRSRTSRIKQRLGLSSEPADSDPSRPEKKEQQIYRPPPAKTDPLEVRTLSGRSRIGATTRVDASSDTTVRGRLGTTTRVDATSDTTVRGRLGLKTGDEKKKSKTGDWGVKTFSEIMREKRLAKEQASNPQEKNTAKVAPLQKTTKRTITPISFNEEAPKAEEPPKKTRKFAPIVFDLHKGDSEHVESDDRASLSVSEKGDGVQAKSISPISFTADSTTEENQHTNSGAKQRKITPIVFSDSSSEENHSKQKTMTPIVFSDPSNGDRSTTETAVSNRKRSLSPVSFGTTTERTTETPSTKVKSPLPKLTITKPNRRSSGDLKSPQDSFKSSGLKTKSPKIKSPTTPGLKSPRVLASERSKSEAPATPSTPKTGGDDSFLREMDMLLEEEEGEPLNEDELEDEDDLLNEMEELLA